jgi:hypothetical protein
MKMQPVCQSLVDELRADPGSIEIELAIDSGGSAFADRFLDRLIDLF